MINAVDNTWSYTLVDADYSQGVLTFTATAEDAAGNPSTATTTTITVDTDPPDAPDFDAASTDRIINATDRSNGVTISGTNVADVTGITLCLGAVGTTCGTTTDITVTTTTWSYSLLETDYTAFGEGVLTFTATATDAVGNPSMPTATTITVDTIVPVFNNGATPTIIISVNTAIAYDAAATDNGNALVTETPDDGLTYTLSAQMPGRSASPPTPVSSPTAAPPRRTPSPMSSSSPPRMPSAIPPCRP